jgi:hypothetical protein
VIYIFIQISRVTIPLLDQEGRIIAVCVGFPEGDDAWPDVQLQAADCLDKARRLLHFKKKEQTNRRGTFLALAVGISHGGGQTHPKILTQDLRNKTILDNIMKEPAFSRISGFTSSKSHRYFSLKVDV